MEQHIVRIISIEHLTHDVLKIVTEKPERYYFTPGQATEIAIRKEGWEEERRPFTFTNLPKYMYLEFSIKTYPETKGVTNQLLQLKKNDELILYEVFGAISYKGEGTFIAGGAGVTPFICIFRDLAARNEVGNNKLIFANKTRKDIILKDEFSNLLGKNFINVLSDEKTAEYDYGYINRDFLKRNITEPNNHIYVCGPPPMMEAVEKILTEMSIDENLIVKEEI